MIYTGSSIIYVWNFSNLLESSENGFCMFNGSILYLDYIEYFCNHSIYFSSFLKKNSKEIEENKWRNYIKYKKAVWKSVYMYVCVYMCTYEYVKESILWHS